MSSEMRYAARYLEIGWSVFPIVPESKRPAIPWKRFQTELPSKEELETWIDNGCHLAIALGKQPNLCVIDDDREKHDLPPAEIESSVVSLSPSGGKHYFFLNDERITSNANSELYVDAKGTGGYVILPPFGGRKWIQPPSKENLDLLIKPPEEWVKQIVGSRRLKQEPLDMSDVIGKEAGGRNNDLHRFAVSIFSRTRKDKWDSYAIQAIVAMNNTMRPPLGAQELMTLTNSARSFVEANPPDRGYYETLQSQEEKPKRTPAIRYDNMDDATITKIDKPEEMPLGLGKFDNKFPFPAGYYLVCASPGAGKGWFALWLARIFFQKYEKKTVLFSLEMPESAVRERLMQAWSDLTQDEYKRGEDVSSGIRLMKESQIAIYPFGEENQQYQTPENFKKDFEEFYKHGYRVFMFDHFHEIEGANDNNKNQEVVEKWGKKFQEISKKYRDVWMIIFVQPNGAASIKNIIKRTDMAGGKGITQRCEVFMSINRPIATDEQGNEVIDEENRNVILYIDKSRYTSSSHFGTRMEFLYTGNFCGSKGEHPHLESRVAYLSRPIKENENNLGEMVKSALL